MNYPKVFFPMSVSRSGEKLVRILFSSYPGGYSESSNIIFQWGQRTGLPGDKTTVIFDCGYFRRDHLDGSNRHYRLSINEYHPTKLPPAPPDRWEKLGLKIESLYDPSGPIILVGRGGKTRQKQGNRAPIWETQTLKKIKRTYPGRLIIYRPKMRKHQQSVETLHGTKVDVKSTIRELCEGASLVVTQWSNVGNEAIMYGIPVVSEGGPASDICPKTIAPGQEPLSYDERAEFLHRLAYWQWSIDEIRRGDIWPWLIKQIGGRL